MVSFAGPFGVTVVFECLLISVIVSPKTVTVTKNLEIRVLHFMTLVLKRKLVTS